MAPVFRIASWLFVGASFAAGLTAATSSVLANQTSPPVAMEAVTGDTLALQVSVRASPDELAWFRSMKPWCNPVEVEVFLRRSPPPATGLGAAYQAVCFALAGRIESARVVMDRLEPPDRARAVGMVFDAAHPVADAGDEKSAGPVMELVVHYQPTHYMALYHAGMAAFAEQRHDLARRHLANFLEYYSANDGWRTNALDALRRMAEP